MLDPCAPGHRRVEKPHHWRITFRAQVYPTLSKGKHGRRANPEVFIGHVRQMVNQFEIMDCARRHIPQL